MIKTGSKEDGYITVYLSLTTGIILSLIMALLWGARIVTIRTQTECVTDMALDSALAEYHRQLLKQYGLFFVDTSYGTGRPSEHNTEEHIRDYMTMNFKNDDYFGLGIGKDLTALSVGSVSLERYSVASDQQGGVMQRQAVEYMKNKTGLSLLEKAAEAAGIIQGNGLLSSDLEQKLDEAEQEVKDAITHKKEEEGENWAGQETELPSEEVHQAKGEGILKLAAEGHSLSYRSIPVESLLTHRDIRTGGGLPDGIKACNSITDRELFLEYIMEKCGYFGHSKEGSAMAYQVEYILQGEANDLENLKKTAGQILMIREAANAAYLFSDAGKKAEAEQIALILSALLTMPELTEPLTQLILLAWAYAESVKDIRMLFDGEKVAVIKNAENWNTPLTQLITFKSHLGEYRTGNNGLSYKEYLKALLFMQAGGRTTSRLMDVMEADIRKSAGNSGFRMDGCIDSMEAYITVNSGYGYGCSIRREYRYM